MSFYILLRPKILLILICLLFLLTRLYKISEIPASVYWDEASIGYNAYSIAQTGKDEWGESFPLHFRAFGEFKLPIYIYSTVILVKIFGMNEFSVRLPAVLYSLGTILLTYLLAKKIFDNSNVALLSSFFISISPWIFIFSRTGYEATAGLFFYLLGIYFFLLWSKNNLNIFFVTLSFILSSYSYNSFRVIIPLTVITLILLEFKNLKILIKKSIIPIILSVVILFLSIVPIYKVYVYDSGRSRLQTVGEFSGASFISNYISHFNPRFIFFGDSNLRSQQGGFGQIFPLESLLLLLGVIYILMRKLRNNYLALVLLLVSFIPAAITKEAPHALRSISVAPFIAIISASSLFIIKKFIKNIYIFELVIIIVSLIFFLNYFINFINIYSVKSSTEWQYGYKKIYSDFKNQFTNFDQIIISDQYAQPYIFALFYMQINPDEFRNNAVRNSVDQWGFSTISEFGKFKFGKIDKILNSNLQNSIVFASNKEKQPNLDPMGVIKFLDGSVAFWVYKI